MTTAPSLTDQQQYELVYQALCAVASRCDGAVTRDMKGFDGVDTHFGRRVASVPFADWTEDVRREAARIMLKYREQALRWTGLEMRDLPVVMREQDFGTNYAARDQARGYERRAAQSGEIAKRKAVRQGELIQLTWTLKDPDFNEIKEAVRAITGRRWTGQVWEVPVCAEAIDVIERYAFSAPFSLDQVRQEAAAAPVHYDITKLSGSKAKIKAPYNAERVAEARQLPGRRWTGEYDEVSITSDLVSFAARWHLTVHPDVLAALDGVQAAADEESAREGLREARNALMRSVSRCQDPRALPAAFVALVDQARAR